MVKLLKKIVLWVYLNIHSILVRIGISLYNTEIEILKANPFNLGEGDKKIQRNLHKNQTLEKFYAGQRDERYVQDYYEILQKADKFMKNATQHQIAIAVDKHGSNLAKRDIYGRRYEEHLGFFDEKHKHKDKTLKAVLELELTERRTKDDEYELLYIFNNKPIEVGISGVFDVLKKKNDGDQEYDVLDAITQSKQFEFPIKISRENDGGLNKIEQLTEFLHVKKIGFDYRLLEFFIPLKFKTNEINIDTDLFNDLISINNVYIRDEYGELIGFSIIKFNKRLIHNDMYDVLKFESVVMPITNK